MTETEPTSDDVSEAERLAREAWGASFVMRANRVAREQKMMRRRLLATTISAVPLGILAFVIAGKVGSGSSPGWMVLTASAASLLGAFALSATASLRSMHARLRDLESRFDQVAPQGGPSPKKL